MPRYGSVRIAAILGLSLFALGAECDPARIVEVFCTQHPEDPRCEGDKVVFVTSQLVSANMGGLAGADATCNELADASPLAGKIFVAWLSTSTVDARDRLTDPMGAFLGTDGVTIATSLADLTDGAIDAPIRHDENGTVVSDPMRVWTGTRPDGTSQGYHCGDWQGGMTIGRHVGLIGRADETDDYWTSWTTNPCENLLRLYCFEI